jgi:hypothetical protein
MTRNPSRLHCFSCLDWAAIRSRYGQKPDHIGRPWNQVFDVAQVVAAGEMNVSGAVSPHVTNFAPITGKKWHLFLEGSERHTDCRPRVA